mmetsp:Transcript_25888/g.39172  ORF Transcript_25888/g.39172 Transcript_25888/m.39172 type:complete len:208 (+) Transcript_25888:1049-1672(+)
MIVKIWDLLLLPRDQRPESCVYSMLCLLNAESLLLGNAAHILFILRSLKPGWRAVTHDSIRRVQKELELLLEKVYQCLVKIMTAKMRKFKPLGKLFLHTKFHLSCCYHQVHRLILKTSRKNVKTKAQNITKKIKTKQQSFQVEAAGSLMNYILMRVTGTLMKRFVKQNMKNFTNNSFLLNRIRCQIYCLPLQQERRSLTRYSDCPGP